MKSTCYIFIESNWKPVHSAESKRIRKRKGKNRRNKNTIGIKIKVNRYYFHSLRWASSHFASLPFTAKMVSILLKQITDLLLVYTYTHTHTQYIPYFYVNTWSGCMQLSYEKTFLFSISISISLPFYLLLLCVHECNRVCVNVSSCSISLFDVAVSLSLFSSLYRFFLIE